MMSTLKEFLKELNQESITTRKMLERIPEDQYDYKPHVKSMPVNQLAVHIAELPDWISMAFTTEELDFATAPYAPSVWNNNAELLLLLEKSIAGAQAALEQGKEEDLLPEWVLRNGDQILMKLTKGELIRVALSQTIHHRAQLGVYLRLLDVPIPGSYGPSADEPGF